MTGHRASSAFHPSGRLRDERGSVVAEYAMVLVLVIAVILAIVQVILAVHIRSILHDCAAEGARVAAHVGTAPARAEEYTRDLLASSVAPSYAAKISTTVTPETVDGVEVMSVRVTAPLPLLGLLGPARQFTVVGHAVREDQFVTGPPREKTP